MRRSTKVSKAAILARQEHKALLKRLQPANVFVVALFLQSALQYDCKFFPLFL